MSFTATPVDGSTTPIPMSSAVPDGTNTPLAVEGGPAKSTGGNSLAPVAVYQYDGYNQTMGTQADANTVNTMMGRLTKIRDLLNATLNVAVTNANANGQALSVNSAPVVLPSDQLHPANTDGIPLAQLPATAMYVSSAGGPVDSTGKSQGLNWDKVASWQSKVPTGASGNITSTLVGDNNLVFGAAPKTIIPGQRIQLSVGTGVGVENVIVSTTYVPSSTATTIPLQFPVVTAGSTTAKWDTFGVSGPQLSVLLPFDLPLAVVAAYNPQGAAPSTLATAGIDALNSANALGISAGLYNGNTLDRPRGATVFKPFNAQALTATSGNTPVSIWTPAAGKKFRLMGYWFSVTTAAGLVFHDLATVGGTGIMPIPSPIAVAAGIVQSPPIGNGILSAAANNQLWIDSTIASNVTGFVWGTEE